ncbi:MAG: ABC transporter permease [Candidatus Merdivicinus sp.]|jgi:putative aldouronate transport system permease protein
MTAKHVSVKSKSHWYQVLATDLVRNKWVYLLALPGVLYYIVYHYFPLYGALIAFKDYSPAQGILGSEWVGLEHFVDFFGSFYFVRILKNTLLLSLYSLIFGFPVPIIFALLLNEVRNVAFKKTIQTVTYIPHFISLIVVCGMITNFTATNGIVNTVIELFGGERINFLAKPEWFRTVYVVSDIWQGFGWGSIIYIAALTGIDQELYEAATIDGAGKWKQTIHVTLPGILPTIVIMLILRLGQFMNVGFEKVFLLYNPGIYETADIISTFVYRRGILEADFSYSAAVGLFNSLINLILVWASNKISQKLTETSLW